MVRSPGMKTSPDTTSEVSLGLRRTPKPQATLCGEGPPDGNEIEVQRMTDFCEIRFPVIGAVVERLKL